MEADAAAYKPILKGKRFPQFVFLFFFFYTGQSKRKKMYEGNYLLINSNNSNKKKFYLFTGCQIIKRER